MPKVIDPERVNNLPRKKLARKSTAAVEIKSTRSVRHRRRRNSTVHWGAEIGVAVVGALLASGILTVVEHTSVAVYDHSMRVSWK